MKKIHLSLTFPIFLSIISYGEFMFLSLTKYCWLDSHLFNCLSVDMIYSSIQQLILTRLMILLFGIFLKLLSYKLDEKDKATQSITSVHVFIAIKVIKLSKRPCFYRGWFDKLQRIFYDVQISAFKHRGGFLIVLICFFFLHYV